MGSIDLMPFQMQIYKAAQGGRLKLDPSEGIVDTLSGAAIGRNRVQALVQAGYIDGAPHYLPTGQTMPAAPGKAVDITA